MKLSQEDIITIVETVHKTGYQYFNLETDGFSLTIGESPAIAPADKETQAGREPLAESSDVTSALESTSAQKQSSAEPSPLAKSTDVTVEAPVVGLFYRSPAPDDPPFIQEGDNVKAGDTLGLIEVMKVYNSVASSVDGTVVKILVGDREGVEFGQPLVIIRPSETLTGQD